MEQVLGRNLYSLGASLILSLHFFMFLFYFAAIPLLFTKTLWSLIAAAYLVFEWLQYLIFDSCVLNVIENDLLEKSGKQNHKQAYLVFLHNLVRGQGSRVMPKPKVDKLSWYFKTACFVASVIILVMASPIRISI